MAKKGKGNQIAIYVIVGLICVAMLGFGATSFGGHVNSIGKVGDRDISTQRYYRALLNRIGQISEQTGTNVTLAQAQSFGLDQAALQELIATVALEAEAGSLGLSAGDERIAEEILQIRAFQALDGSFDRTAYSQSLRANGLTERLFEDDLRAEISRTIVQGAVIGGVETPPVYADTLMNFIAERRNFAWGTVSELAEPLADATDEDLTAYFAENEDAFMLPETRQITYAWLTPDMILDTITVAEEDLQALYDSRLDEFNIPERRVVERLILGDAAQEAKTRLDAGELTFDELVAERELTLAAIDLGDVSLADLGEAGEDVFAAELGVVGPVETSLGAALFRVNAILAAQETSFEDARADLETELGREEALTLIGDQIDGIDDLLAGGATLEELADETEMELAQIDWSVDSEGGIADFAAFRQAAAAAAKGDFPEVEELDDGGLFALRLNEVIDPRLPEFEAARADIEAAWRADATLAALTAQADELVAELNAGTMPEGLEMSDETDITRTSFVAGTSAEFLIEVFKMAKGDILVVPNQDAVQIVRLDDILPPNPEDENLATQRETLESATERGIANDILGAFAAAVQADAGISLDQAAINAVHVNIP